MTTPEPGDRALGEFQAVARRAGLDLNPQELERLWPLYQQLMAQVSLLHDPSLPLEEPAMIFPAAWFPR